METVEEDGKGKMLKMETLEMETLNAVTLSLNPQRKTETQR